MGRRWLTRKDNSILKSNLPIGVQNMTLKSIDLPIILKNIYDLNICAIQEVIYLNMNDVKPGSVVIRFKV